MNGEDGTGVRRVPCRQATLPFVEVRARAARDMAAIYAMVDSLGDVKKVTRLGDPEELQRLYERLNLEIVYNATGRTLDGSIRPVGRDKASVRGGT